MKTTIFAVTATGLAVSTLAISVAIFGAAPAKVHAQTAANNNQAPGSGQALEIGPPVVNLTADPGQVIKTQLSLRDISKDSLLVKAQVNDFTAAGEDGTPKLLLKAGESNPYSIKTWVAQLPEQLLQSRQLKQLPLTINVPADAAPGGYYGVVRFTASAPELNSSNGGVSLAASLGALVFVRVNGQAKESMNLQDFFVSQNSANASSASVFESAPVKFTQRVKNDGNVFEQPTGQVTVKDMFGKKVGVVNVNLPTRNVLPGTTRKFEQPLDKSVIGNKHLFGRYSASMNLTYGQDSAKKTLSGDVSFWVIPYKLILGIVVVLVGGFFLLRFGLKRYNRSILERAKRSKK